jgi:hypothetical protein
MWRAFEWFNQLLDAVDTSQTSELRPALRAYLELRMLLASGTRAGR